MDNKNGVDYYYILFKLLLELPDVTPKQFELLMETMDDFNLLSKDGENIRGILQDHIYYDYNI